MIGKRRHPFERPSSEGSKKRRKWMVILGSFLIIFFGALYFFVLPYKPIPSQGDSTEPASPPPQETPTPEPRYQTIEGEIRAKSTFSKSLAQNKISQSWIELIVLKLKPLVDFKKIKGGKFRFISDEKGELIRFIYEGGPTEIYEVEKGALGYTAQKKDVPLETRLVKVGGEIRSSLFEAVDAIGEKDQLMIFFSEILASEIDFYKDVQKGDRFQILVEKVYKEKEFIRYGPIHAVEYQRGDKLIQGIHFQGDFYNEKGFSLKKAFLKAPLRFNRISSRFTGARKHPILGGVLPHYGVDYAAPSGTSVWAVANGTITACGWGGGFGKQVVIRHPNGYVTYYGHLSGYGPGIRKGVRVDQKQVIGYVGSTGLSTGPHLDYRMAKDGRFRNPLKESFPTGLPIEKRNKEGFQNRRDEMLSLLQRTTPEKERFDEGKKM